MQLASTLMFNLDTVDAMRTRLSWEREDLLIWTPNMLGCACFLIGSYLMLPELFDEEEEHDASAPA